MADTGDALKTWVDAIHALYPPGDADGWDEVGLHVGDPSADGITGVLVTLDVTAAVLDEAQALGANLVLAHHPLLFRALGRLTPESASGRLALDAARRGIAVMAAHTNLDVAVDGTSHPVADVLGLVDRRPLRPLASTPPGTPRAGDLVKIVTFTPRRYSDVAVRAMSAAGAGLIGDYTECAFTAPGTGTFRPSDDADPTVGARGQREHVPEDRIEMVLTADRAADVVAALRRAHPYEEVPFDLYPLLEVDDVDVAPSTHAFDAADSTTPRASRPADGDGRGTAEPSQPRRRGRQKGHGLIGTLPEPVGLLALAARLRADLPSPALRLAAPDVDAEVTTVAVCGGAGDSFIGDAIAAGADVFVTGDLRHHVALDALTLGLALVDAGHYWTENPAMDACVHHLTDAAGRRGLTAPIHRSTVVTDPWTIGPI